MPSLPSKLHLPGGLVVQLAMCGAPSALRRRPRMPLFSEVKDLLASGAVTAKVDGVPLDLEALPLGTFHALRALLTHGGWLFEETVTITCRNCDAELRVRACESMPIGPFAFGELHDPELDTTLPFGVDHRVEALATTVRFRARTLGDAEPLHRALRRRELRITARFVTAMGLEAIGTETAAAALAATLARASDKAFAQVAEVFLHSHYPPRLLGLVACTACGARNDVDAPFERELEVGPPSPTHADAFPTFEAFADAAEAIARPLVDASVRFVVEEGVPACDDGGEPLLGSYVPAFEGHAAMPSRDAEVTLYYRTFRAVWDDDGPYDVEAEIRETIEHELEHHEAALTGYDPMDEDERAEIRAEATRLHGQRALALQAASELGADVKGFVRRTWPLWLMVVLLLLAVVAAER